MLRDTQFFDILGLIFRQVKCLSRYSELTLHLVQASVRVFAGALFGTIPTGQFNLSLAIVQSHVILLLDWQERRF